MQYITAITALFLSVAAASPIEPIEGRQAYVPCSGT